MVSEIAFCANTACCKQFVIRRPQQRYCSGPCRTQAFKLKLEHGTRGTVKSVRLCKSGMMSVTVEVEAAGFSIGQAIALMEIQ